MGRLLQTRTERLSFATMLMFSAAKATSHGLIYPEWLAHSAAIAFVCFGFVGIVATAIYAVADASKRRW